MCEKQHILRVMKKYVDDDEDDALNDDFYKKFP
jgi:hypothetical protein